ncbi:MAG: hypothetical protein HY903_09765 [Deltaproteobacteria bacterium]|nr:hypothetical protein [Deltaproteobacteria bacterium]
MNDGAGAAEAIEAALGRALTAALELDGTALTAATLALEAGLHGLPRSSPERLRVTRGRLLSFLKTCRFLSRTLADCLDATVSELDPGARRHYLRRGALSGERAPALVLTRYG